MLYNIYSYKSLGNNTVLITPLAKCVCVALQNNIGSNTHLCCNTSHRIHSISIDIHVYDATYAYPFGCYSKQPMSTAIVDKGYRSRRQLRGIYNAANALIIDVRVVLLSIQGAFQRFAARRRDIQITKSKIEQWRMCFKVDNVILFLWFRQHCPMGQLHVLQSD